MSADIVWKTELAYFSFQSKAAYVLFYTRRDDPNHEMMNTSELVTEDREAFPNSEHYMDTK